MSHRNRPRCQIQFQWYAAITRNGARIDRQYATNSSVTSIGASSQRQIKVGREHATHNVIFRITCIRPQLI